MSFYYFKPLVRIVCFILYCIVCLWKVLAVSGVHCGWRGGIKGILIFDFLFSNTLIHFTWGKKKNKFPHVESVLKITNKKSHCHYLNPQKFCNLCTFPVLLSSVRWWAALCGGGEPTRYIQCSHWQKSHVPSTQTNGAKASWPKVVHSWFWTVKIILTQEKQQQHSFFLSHESCTWNPNVLPGERRKEPKIFKRKEVSESISYENVQNAFGPETGIRYSNSTFWVPSVPN